MNEMDMMDYFDEITHSILAASHRVKEMLPQTKKLFLEYLDDLEDNGHLHKPEKDIMKKVIKGGL